MVNEKPEIHCGDRPSDETEPLKFRECIAID